MGSFKMSYGVMNMICGAALVMTMMMAGEVAGQAAPAPSVDCQTVVFKLTDCLTFVTGTVKTPPASCCTNLSAVINTTPQCLCLLFNTTFTQPLGVNVTLAQQLPPACKLQTPPTSLCSAFGVPVPGPTSATSPVVAPSPAKTPVSAKAPKAPASGPAMAPAPSSGPAAATPTSSPPGPMSTGESNSTTTAPAPSSAPSITSRGAITSVSLLILASIILS